LVTRASSAASWACCDKRKGKGRERGKEWKRNFFDRMKQKGKARAGYFSARRKVGLLGSLQVEIGCKLNKMVAIEHNSVEMMLVVMLSVQKSEVAAVAVGRPGRRGLPCIPRPSSLLVDNPLRLDSATAPGVLGD
jgi:hypothetical protein